VGQIFFSCAYDADKFHANCYSFSGSVFSTHYLLRQKPYRIMWGGIDVLINNELSDSKTEYLLGLSTYFEIDESDLANPEYGNYSDKVKFIYDNNKSWEKINVWEEAKEYFKMDLYKCVKYKNFLVNHTQKLAIDLADYFDRSRGLTHDGTDYVIDAIPVLTETGGGAQMAFLEGITDETTEQLAGRWCGDILQIVDKLPENYSLINCCFAGITSKLFYNHDTFGTNKEGFLLKDDKGNLLKGVMLNLYGKRGPASKFKTEKLENSIKFIPTPC
jgi:hypothetical protein